MARLPLASPLDRALFLKSQPYFEGLSPNLLALLASHCEELVFPAGALARPANRPIESVLFFGSGRLALEYPDSGGRTSFEIAPPGAIGISDHLAASPTTPAVRALEETACLAFAAADLDQILEDHFPLVHQFARASGDTIVRVRQALADERSDEPGFDAADLIETPAQLDLVQRLARARRAPFFRGTNLTLLAELVKVEVPQLVEPGDFLWKAGDPIDRMVLVLDGRFRTDGAFGLARAGAGATIGAWEIAATGPRFEGWFAETPSRVLPIERELFVDLLEDHFEFAQAYLRHLSREVVAGIRARAFAARGGRDVR